ncbi:hypothetical protein V6N13_129821 [Hibiscus sabdariffa]
MWKPFLLLWTIRKYYSKRCLGVYRVSLLTKRWLSIKGIILVLLSVSRMGLAFWDVTNQPRYSWLVSQIGTIGCIVIVNLLGGILLLMHSLNVFVLESWKNQKDFWQKLHQITTVSKYRGRFEAVSNRTLYLPPLFLVHCFVSGLRADIKHVLIHKPMTLEDCMSLAHLQEQWIALEKGLVRPSLGNSKPLLPTPKMATTDSVLQPQPLRNLPLNSSNQKLGFRRLTPAKTAQKRAQGLCYRCDENYTWDHKCKNTPQLLLFDDEPDPPPPPNDSSIGSSEGDARVAKNLANGGSASPFDHFLRCLSRRLLHFYTSLYRLWSR